MTDVCSSLEFHFVPSDVLRVMEVFRKAGFKVWLVGGALRDHLLGRLPKDWDLATHAEAHETIGLFPKVIPVGLRHGTVQVHTDERDIEVTSVRRKDAEEGEGILDDLARRDFTVNALALSYPEGILYDPHGGCTDLQDGLLRAVRDARARFREDPLRTLRAGRFLSVYGFRIDEEMRAALKEESHGLDQVANERIRDELLKMLMGNWVVEAFEWMRDGGVLQEILPEVLESYETREGTEQEEDMAAHSMHMVKASPPRLKVRLAALLHRIGEPRFRRRMNGAVDRAAQLEASTRMAEEIMTRWRMPRKRIREVSVLIENQLPTTVADWNDADVRRLLSRVGEEHLEDLLHLARADRISSPSPAAALEELEIFRSRTYGELRKHPPLRLQDLALSGEAVMKTLRLKPGPVVGEILKRLHQKVIENPQMNDRNILMDYLKKEYHGKSVPLMVQARRHGILIEGGREDAGQELDE